MAALSILNQSNEGNKSYITDAIVTEQNVHSRVMYIHNCFKFHMLGCLVMTQFIACNAIQGQ